MAAEEHPFTHFVRTLGRGKTSSRDLTQQEAHEAMQLIMEGSVHPEQLGAFLMLLRVKEETAEEIAGFCTGVQSRWAPLPSVSVDIDWSCYAGKKRQLPWLVLVQCLLADLGYRQCIHGTRGHTPGRLYVQDVYQTLGLPVLQSREDLTTWDPAQPAFLPLAVLAPQLEEIIQLRHLLGLRSPVHSFARLLNPFAAPTVLQAIFHPGYHKLHQGAAALLGYQTTLVIKGDGGEFERNPHADLTQYWSRMGQTSETTLPRVFTDRANRLEVLDIKELLAVWRGQSNDRYGEAAVTETLALALEAHENLTPEQARDRARQTWSERNRSLL
ncbi:MAG: glycosyl transferase family protein [Natronospirillum sp.]|uniref:glycosyl transferase family protein n=1 Tax=Natronospirillum sp. TaxID=2812955 RepID=UPI0025DF580B|nr:glycosyl transferase family protein [Natronospirillum sp.]MCH8552394.1 glycosyl transferase family protein [Natronospirillum sp.]